MLKRFSLIALVASCCFILSNCSVYKASSNEGVSVSDILKCQQKGCFLSLGMDIVSGHQDSDDKYVETYRGIARKSGANYLRATGHAVADVFTLGLWEVVGTPVEGAISNNRGYITVIATYPSKESIDVENMQVFNAFGKKVDLKKKTNWKKK